MLSWTYPSGAPLELRVTGAPAEWALLAGTQVVARMMLPEKGAPTLTVDRRTWRLEPYARGWKLAVIPEDRDEPDAPLLIVLAAAVAELRRRMPDGGGAADGGG